MKKKIFGVKLSTVLTFFVCLIIAFAVWTVVNYRDDYSAFINFSAFDFFKRLK